jgi:hypothetical protein
MVTFRQRIVPPEVLGRVHALARSLASLRTPLGAAAGDMLASSFATGRVMALTGSVPLTGSLGLARLPQLSAR